MEMDRSFFALCLVFLFSCVFTVGSWAVGYEAVEHPDLPRKHIAQKVKPSKGGKAARGAKTAPSLLDDATGLIKDVLGQFGLVKNVRR
jgi:hypothetical protein